ncbi:MAG: hypothetical protein JOZ08_11935, partial [Verrucomicrobia bacterium]|nr:hypothetical protein [Verrucomicrobiota bacterium]
DGSSRTYSAQSPTIGAAGIVVLGIDQNIALSEGDIVQVRVAVFGNSTANVDVFADTTSGFTVFDGYLV